MCYAMERLYATPAICLSGWRPFDRKNWGGADHFRFELVASRRGSDGRPRFGSG